MKNFKIFILITGILVAACAVTSVAQTRPKNTSSAKAYYGHKPGKPKTPNAKKNMIKTRNFTHTKPAKGTRASDKRRYMHS
jgi:hypothetical protein